MKLLNFALIKITLCLISGIIFAFYYVISLKIVLTVIVTAIVCLSAILIIEKGRLIKSVVFGILTIITFFAIGILSLQLHNQKNFTNHYTNYVNPITDTIHSNTFRIREVLKGNAYYDKYYIDVLAINAQNRSGKILLNVKKDSLYETYHVDDIFVSSAPLQQLNTPLNPYQFDYKAYLQNQYIYHQIFTEHEHLLKSSSELHTVFGYASHLRRTINTKLKAKNFNSDELALINALLLGQRQDISPEIYESYTKAGAIHILAVSGLHVGIVLLLLNSLFKPIAYLKHGKTIKTILIVSILWGFAVVAGLSASVTRAVMMFSIIAIGMNLKRPTNIFNTLAISMFILLLFKPMFLFDVGFQMSYLAVIAIVTIQPILVKLWRPKFSLVDKLWQIFTVTLAAQCGVVPISLFYFHQFPGLFFLSNLVIIPILGFILGLGILIIMLGLINLLPQWLADIYGSIISMMNHFVRWVSLQERFVFNDISFSLLKVIFAYILILALLFVVKKQSYYRISIALIAILIFQSAFIYEKTKNRTDAFIVFHKNRTTLIGIKSNASLNLYHALDNNTITKDYAIPNYRIGTSIKTITHDTLQHVYAFKNDYLVIVDSLGVFSTPKIRPKYVLLRNSPKINLTRLLDSLRPDMVIADGSNYKSYMTRWEVSCRTQKIPFHMTSKKGAFIIDNSRN